MGLCLPTVEGYQIKLMAMLCLRGNSTAISATFSGFLKLRARFTKEI